MDKSIMEFAEEHFRGSGRTKAMIDGAKVALAEGKEVFIIGHTYQYACELCRLAPGAKPVAMDEKPERLIGLRKDTLVLVDHAVHYHIQLDLKSKNHYLRKKIKEFVGDKKWLSK